MTDREKIFNEYFENVSNEQLMRDLEETGMFRKKPEEVFGEEQDKNQGTTYVTTVGKPMPIIGVRPVGGRQRRRPRHVLRSFDGSSKLVGRKLPDGVKIVTRDAQVIITGNEAAITRKNK
ncbi:hypothetical protein E4665_15805 [Sporolactobacillus shoreae]|uniref:Uncharacterized protein n=1 Tax=Sporolactobacillus shoreae TaxID=1465501 RepID=A0A4Z0GK54_9BACL|nr:hypothetical protein [Sporolactobacillus shoreae]TGA96328.1 hypothetical protein E4665_15805 [Sporolactobacillus shoreae]